MKAVDLTKRGRSVVSATVALALAGWIAGIAALFFVAVFCISMLVVCAAYLELRPLRIRCELRADRSLAAVGESNIHTVVVYNSGSRRTPGSRLTATVIGDKSAVRFNIGSIERGGSRSVDFAPTPDRGQWVIDVELLVCDPFGLVEQLASSANSCLVVYPRAASLDPAMVIGVCRGYARSSGSIPGPRGEPGYLRPYRHGDDLRQVHWAATARRDELVIKETTRQADVGRLTLVVDVRASVHTPESFESTLSATTSLVLGCLEAGLAMRVVSTHGFSTAFGVGDDHGRVCLEYLAGATLGGGESDLGGTLGAEESSSVILISSGQFDPATDDLKGVGGRHEQLTLIAVDCADHVLTEQRLSGYADGVIVISRTETVGLTQMVGSAGAARPGSP